MIYYVLHDEHHVVEVPMLEWARWFESISNRRVAWTQITSEVTVSTVFLGIDHRHSGDGPPLLFETMVFGLDHLKPEGGFWENWMWRYASWDDAQAGHNAAVRKARAAIGQKVRDMNPQQRQTPTDEEIREQIRGSDEYSPMVKRAMESFWDRLDELRERKNSPIKKDNP